jgi:signal transduction histidine kinase
MLLGRFILVNILVLLAGAVLSYYLARRTLQPIEDSMRAQAQFISDASHELRTPLTALQTTNEVALRNAKLNVKDARDILKDNVEEVAKLKSLTDGLLRLAHHDEAGQAAFNAEPVSLQDIAGEAMNRIMPAALEKDIAVEDGTQPVMVVGDRQGLVQALVVLLENAVKYSPAGSLVKIRALKKAKQAVLSVQDQGPGIRPYDAGRIFDRFYRADQSRSARHVPGHGIGLALAKKIVEQHGGGISVESVLGKGSTFTIKLPL